MTRLVFLDTEATGLALTDDIWEIAAIVREPGQPDVECHSFVRHSLAKAALLPEAFRADHDARYDANSAITSLAASQWVDALTMGRAHIVGGVPNFDTERLALMMRWHGIEPGWHYHLLDVENLAVGWIHGRYGTRDDAARQAVALPWSSDDLSRACGVEPPGAGQRHTAMGDARWARDLYDAITASTP